MSFTSVDLPEPDTPVTQVKRPTGNDTVTFFRLLPLAPTTRSSCTWFASAGGGAGSLYDPPPLAFLVPVLILVAIGMLAAWIPSRRALKINPAIVLRTT